MPPLPPPFPTFTAPFGAKNAATDAAAAVPLIAISEPGDSWVWDFDNLAVYNEAAKKTPRKATTSSWMKSEKNWRHRVGKGWVAKRVLGRGSFGVVGHWSYEGPDRETKSLKDVAVKQSLRVRNPLGGYGLEYEATALLQLNRAKSQHVVKMYRHLYEEYGENTNAYDTGLVHRIFLEYCPGGDLGEWLRSRLHSNASVSEVEVWAIFHCLARSCQVMDLGTENANFRVPGWPREELVHFDLKLENVFIGALTTDLEHRDASPIKFGDFGMAERVPKVQGPFFLSQRSDLGTPVYYAPEQVLRRGHYGGPRPWFDFLGNHTVQDPRYGSATNVWQVAIMIHCLISRCVYPNWDKNSIDRLRCYNSTLSERLRSSGFTVGNSTDQACEFNARMSGYSEALRILIHECLLVNPRQRPLATAVVRRTGEAIAMARMSIGGILNQEFPPYEEPSLSARWYSGQNNGDPIRKKRAATPAQLTAADKLHAARMVLDNAKRQMGGIQMAANVPPAPPVRPPPPVPKVVSNPFVNQPLQNLRPVQSAQPIPKVVNNPFVTQIFQPGQPAQPVRPAPPVPPPSAQAAPPVVSSAPNSAFINPAPVASTFLTQPPTVLSTPAPTPTPAPVASAFLTQIPAVASPPAPPPAPSPAPAPRPPPVQARAPIRVPPPVPPPRPAPGPAPPRPSILPHPIPKITCIVKSKSFFGADVFTPYTLTNLSSHLLIRGAKRSLINAGCAIALDRQKWMIGRVIMSDLMMLGEFEEDLVRGRIVRVVGL